MQQPTSQFPSPRAWQRANDNHNVYLQAPDLTGDLMASARMPELLSPLRTLELVERFRTQFAVDFGLPALLRSKLGYFLFRSALQCTPDASSMLSFIEDVIAFRLCSSPLARHHTYARMCLVRVASMQALRYPMFSRSWLLRHLHTLLNSGVNVCMAAQS
jgi:hypothetical protein